MDIPWVDWSEQALETARVEGRPIALHIGATWCHWCHVMDEGSYTWPGVAELLAARFVCIRVDTDRRPDLNERYNQGGWPSFAILDAAGEVLVGRTYVSGMELLSLLRSASDPNARWTIAPEPAPVPGASGTTADQVMERVRAAYDPYNHGFGELEKFLHAPVLELLLDRALRAGDPWARGVVDATLTTMAARGVHDAREGGFFRYATQDDWNEPHYEKLLEDQARLLTVYARGGAPAVVASTARWMLRTLADAETGALYGSQDADEAYYRAPVRGTPPPIDRTVYIGWNGLAAAALVRAGAVLDRPGLLAVARRVTDHALGFVDADGRVTRHAGGVAGLLEDQTQLAEGLLAVGAAFGHGPTVDAAARVLDWAWTNLRSDAGGLCDRAPERVGRLRHARRGLHGNAAYARVARTLDAVLSATEPGYDGRWRARAVDCATAALAEAEDWGFLAAPAAAAAERLAAPCITIKVASAGWPVAPMLLAGLADPHPDHVYVAVADGVPEGMAMACSGSACARPVSDAAALQRAIAQLRS